jgi:hypothetical protein
MLIKALAIFVGTGALFLHKIGALYVLNITINMMNEYNYYKKDN